MASILDVPYGDIIRLLTDLFQPEKITCLQKHKRKKCISCKIYTKWSSKDENGKEDTVICCDEVILTNPFEDTGLVAGDMPLRSEDFVKYKQFCFAHGMVPEWMENNPYCTNTTETSVASKI